MPKQTNSQQHYNFIVSKAIEVIGSQKAYRELEPEDRRVLRDEVRHILKIKAKYQALDQEWEDLSNAEDALGLIYVITNPAWPNWVKIGQSINITKRLNDYQTASPLRDYTIFYSIAVKNPRQIEFKIHSRLSDRGIKRKNEWFCLDPLTAALHVHKEVKKYDEL